ncbi:NRAMP (natural resistance-associated macrophage protein)-like metal ion transporter [Novosphingobium kunmingense]|uniref:NRAMP (Natural resistance-associated macrophage protein)-like metal ion transporter n=1 Tax=Novosphingobium kunmingense TaxID=1211806 RepID=A0A2N0H698_9SPHN|nr:divalent metal cation transporter [Novosphingobium kunmingense]PKB14474.1 NRAMP (natural resistance-associated macrophage protein)-like metal ion transporter [Novosphingobium kunmingense]
MASTPEPRSPLEVLGPGLVTGAADDDPSGIGTYSQVGAQFGYAMGWTMLFGFPLLASIQAICARIGATTGRGIAQNLRRHYPPALLRVVVLMLLVANVINLGADLGAMGAVLGLIVPGPVLGFTALFGLVCILVEVFVSYSRFARILRWATLSLFAYVGVVFVAHVPWEEALRAVLVPRFTFDRDHAMALVAIFGTTISPYLFFWQAGQEVEEQHRRHIKPLHVSPRRVAGAELKRIRTDTLVGMGFSHLVALFIIIATAATLHANGVREIDSASQAAEALRPIAGDFAFALFATGVIGTGLLAVPVLAGSAAYAVSETFGWVEGLDRKPREAKAFYGVIAAATLGGVALNLIGIDPMKALYWAAVVNGLLAPPLMVVTMLIAHNRKVMGKLAIGPGLAFGGWLSTAVMALVALTFLFS